MATKEYFLKRDRPLTYESSVEYSCMRLYLRGQAFGLEPEVCDDPRAYFVMLMLEFNRSCPEHTVGLHDFYVQLQCEIDKDSFLGQQLGGPLVTRRIAEGVYVRKDVERRLAEALVVEYCNISTESGRPVLRCRSQRSTEHHRVNRDINRVQQQRLLSRIGNSIYSAACSIIEVLAPRYYINVHKILKQLERGHRTRKFVLY